MMSLGMKKRFLVVAGLGALISGFSAGASDIPASVDECAICVIIGCPNLGDLVCFKEAVEEDPLICTQPITGSGGKTCADKNGFAP